MTHDAPAESKLSPPPRLALAALLFFIFVLHFGTLARHSFWNDEFITLESITLDYPQMIHERLINSHMPGYFVALKAWSAMAGNSEAVLRFPSSVSMLIGILLVWRLGAWLYGERAGIFVLALAGLNQVGVEQGNNARMYASLFMAYALALWALVRYLDRGSARDLMWLVLAGLIGMTLHMLYALAPAAAIIYLVARRRDFPERWWRAGLALALPILLTLPLVTLWTRHQRKLGGIKEFGSFSFVDAARETFIMFTGDYHALNFDPLQYIGIALAAGIVIIAAMDWRRHRIVDEPHRHLGLLLIWVAVPLFAVPLGQVFSNSDMAGNWRYYIMQACAAPLLTVAAALALRRMARPWVANAASVFFFGMVAANSWGFIASPGPGLREVAIYIRDHQRPGDVVVVSRRKHRSQTFVHYGTSSEIPDSVPTSIDRLAEVAKWLESYCAGHRRLWAVFYDDLDEDKLYKALERNPDSFDRKGKLFIYGETAVGLYQIEPPRE